MTARVLLAFLLPGLTTNAQTSQNYLGPTVGISTPDFGFKKENFLLDANTPVVVRKAPIPSPVLGLNGGMTLWKRLALDAGLQYSYTGQAFSQDFTRSGDFIKERLRVHKVAVPLTAGYAANIGRKQVRVGVGGTFQYLAAAKAALHFTYPVNNVQTEIRGAIRPFEAPLVFPVKRLQVLPRVAVSVVPTRRLILTAAYSHGKSRAFIFGPQSGLISSVPRNSAIDLTATFQFKPARLERALQETLLNDPALAQLSTYDKDSIRPCGFRSPSAAAARTFLTTYFDSLSFTPGERIADIGAQSGDLAGKLSLFYDDLDMTLEDIDSNCLNPAQLRANLKYYYNLRERESPKNFKTRIVIGTETSTLLPDAAFTKVFFLNTYHEVAQKEDILRELFRITAARGTLFVTERVSTTKRITRKDCGHGMPLERELLADFRKAGFKLDGTKVSERRRQQGDEVKRMTFRFRKD